MDTSWNKVGDWYGKIVGTDGHYYHRHVILPNSLRLLDLDSNSRLLDVGCGNGWFAHHIPQTITYVGIDAAKSLINQATNVDKNKLHKYFHCDITNTKLTVDGGFTHIVSILSLQNMEFPQKALSNISLHTHAGSKLLLVINHPMFRIPRQSEWGIDQKSKIQYRRINRYLSPLKIPISAHPGQNDKTVTWSFHYSLTDYSRFLKQSGFVIDQIEEWVSDKVSQGPAAKMENFARAEFPLFMAILAKKL